MKSAGSEKFLGKLLFLAAFSIISSDSVLAQVQSPLVKAKRPDGGVFPSSPSAL
jgi:hypothetical protein